MFEYNNYKNVSYTLDYCTILDRWEYSFSEFYYHNNDSNYISGSGYENTKTKAIRAAEKDIDREISRLN